MNIDAFIDLTLGNMMLIKRCGLGIRISGSSGLANLFGFGIIIGKVYLGILEIMHRAFLILLLIELKGTLSVGSLIMVRYI
jgi:hypothetical protein